MIKSWANNKNWFIFLKDLIEKSALDGLETLANDMVTALKEKSIQLYGSFEKRATEKRQIRKSKYGLISIILYNIR